MQLSVCFQTFFFSINSKSVNPRASWKKSVCFLTLRKSTMSSDNNSTVQFENDLILVQALTNFILSGVITTLICIGGLVGNLLSTIVLIRPGWKSSTGCILLGLTAADSTCLVAVLVGSSIPHIVEYTSEAGFKWLEAVMIPIYKYLIFTGSAAQFGSIYFTVAITVERFIAVCYPFKARQVCTWEKARYCVAGIFIWAILVNLGKLWETEVITIASNENVTDSEEILMLQHTALFKSKNYKIWEQVYTFILQFSIPLLIIITLNIKIHFQISSFNKARQTLTSQQKEDIAITKVLVCVVVIFLISHLGRLADVILRTFFNTTSELWIRISDLLYTINSSINFLIYVFGGKKFRMDLIRILVSRFPFLKNIFKIHDPVSRQSTTQTSRLQSSIKESTF